VATAAFTGRAELTFALVCFTLALSLEPLLGVIVTLFVLCLTGALAVTEGATIA
jgi:hypothetical protein